jgi:hypothetical protein
MIGMHRSRDTDRARLSAALVIVAVLAWLCMAATASEASPGVPIPVLKIAPNTPEKDRCRRRPTLGRDPGRSW